MGTVVDRVVKRRGKIYERQSCLMQTVMLCLCDVEEKKVRDDAGAAFCRATV